MGAGSGQRVMERGVRFSVLLCDGKYEERKLKSPILQAILLGISEIFSAEKHPASSKKNEASLEELNTGERLKVDYRKIDDELNPVMV
jgi:hypothetical protein